jgi:biopolymer transport protein ExbD
MNMRRGKRRSQAEVELNLAAMLDMAFQLLAFFILTFQPTDPEGQIAMRLPPPESIVVVKDGKQAGTDVHSKDPLAGMNTLVVSIGADRQTGRIASMAVGEAPLAGDLLGALDARLKELFGRPDAVYDQIILQVSDACRYDELMKVIEKCSRQRLPGGKKLPGLSFVELPGG